MIAHEIKYLSALNNRAVYAGVYTSDLVLVSLAAFMISIIFKGQSIELIYVVMGLVCVPMYLILLVKNRWWPKLFFLMFFRKLLGLKIKSIYFKKELRAWDF